jgi:YD repeat-containing protein
MSCQIDDANGQCYTYDVLYQLTDVDYNDGHRKTGYSYDAVGNRTQVDINDSSELIDYTLNDAGLNQYDKVGRYEYDYDNKGNLTDVDYVGLVECGDFDCESPWTVWTNVEQWFFIYGIAYFEIYDQQQAQEGIRLI